MPEILSKKIYGLIGFPVKHSLSAAMHNAAFKALAIDAEYKLFEVAPEQLGSFLETLKGRNIQGLNVTVPYKERVIDFVTLGVDNKYLQRIGAINTIVNKEGQWLGFNTDIFGLEKHLVENFDVPGKRVALLGAGGASRAVVYVLAKSKAKEVAVFDIDKSKSRNICTMIKSMFDFHAYSVDRIDDLALEDKDLLINATPVGLKENDPLPIPEKLLHKDLFVYDLIYNPAQTKLLAAAKNIGAKTSNGLGMLLYQGMQSFEIWIGKKAPRQAMEAALNQALSNSLENSAEK
jgi:shikimate 5-dehydrogenase